MLKGSESVEVHEKQAVEPEQFQDDWTTEIIIYNEILRNTSDLSSNWVSRVASIKSLKYLCERVHLNEKDCNEVYEYFQPFIPCINKQLTDRRSTLIKDVSCELINLAKFFGDNFSLVAADILPSLLSLVIVTIKVISECAISTIEYFLTSCPSISLIPILFSTLKSKKSPILQQVSSKLLLKYINNNPNEAITDINSILSILLIASDCKARKIAKMCYEKYFEIDQIKAKEFFEISKFDIQAKLR